MKNISYVRVKDVDTGHELDLPDNHPLLKTGKVAALDPGRYPPSLVARPTKHHIAAQEIVRPSVAANKPKPESATDEEKSK